MPTARYAFVQSSYWSGFCLIVSFASVYLLGNGVSNAEIGVIVAVAGVVSTVLQPLVAGIAERSRRPLRAWIVLFAVIVSAVAAVLLAPGLGWLLRAVSYALMIATVQIVQPLVNAVGMAAINLGHRVNFGVARASGSLTFAVVSVLAGRVVDRAGPGAIPVMIIAVQALFALAAATFVFHRAPADHDGVHAHAGAAAPPSALGRREWIRFGILLTGITLAMASHNLINTFMFQIVTHHGGGAGDMGTAIMIAALVELPTMIGWSRAVARWTPGTLLLVSGAAFVVKSFATWLAPGLWAIYVAQGLQFAAFGLLIPASIYYVNRIFPPGQRVTGQAYMTMTATAGSVIGSLLGGSLLDVLGVPTLLFVGACVAILGAAGIVAGADRR